MRSDDAHKNHGIGLFNSIITSGENSKIKSFTVKGSVNTEIYDNAYKMSGQEMTIPHDATANFISVSGVCGAAAKGVTVNFEGITLDDLSLCRSCIVGGLLGYSSNNRTVSNTINVIQCNADNLSLKMNSSSNLSSVTQARNRLRQLYR